MTKPKAKVKLDKLPKLIEDAHDVLGDLPQHWDRLSERQKALVPRFDELRRYIAGEVA